MLLKRFISYKAVYLVKSKRFHCVNYLQQWKLLLYCNHLAMFKLWMYIYSLIAQICHFNIYRATESQDLHNLARKGDAIHDIAADTEGCRLTKKSL